MVTTILTEAINGWTLELFSPDGLQRFVYETLKEAQDHRNRFEVEHEYWKKEEVSRHGSHC